MEYIMSREIGKIHEDRALAYLVKRGLKPITRNYSNRTGEIDLIMNDRGTCVFVEVRFRHKDDYGFSSDTITPAKQRKIIRTALLYLQENNLIDRVDCRIDVIAIDQGSTSGIEWFQNAIETGY